MTSSNTAFFAQGLAQSDPEVAGSIRDELKRQQEQIELIASENIVSLAVLEAQGSVLTNKYAEGYPGRRYYGGCEYVDVAEQLAIDRAKQLFGCEFVNVQPHSGAQANQCVMLALLKPGDTILGLALSAQQVQDMRNGLQYVNVHSINHGAPGPRSSRCPRRRDRRMNKTWRWSAD